MSFNDYCLKKKPKLLRLFIMVLIQMLSVIFTIRCIILSITDDQKLRNQLGDIMYLTRNPKLVNLLGVASGITSIVMRTIHFWGESKGKLEILNVLNNLHSNDKEKHNLEDEYFIKIRRRAKFLQMTFCSRFIYTPITQLIVASSLLSYTAYYDPEREFNLFVLIFFNAYLILFWIQVGSTATISFAIYYLSFKYCQYRFFQLNNRFLVEIKKNKAINAISKSIKNGNIKSISTGKIRSKKKISPIEEKVESLFIVKLNPNLVNELIHEHHSVSRIVEKYNETCCLIGPAFCIGGAFCQNILLYLSMFGAGDDKFRMTCFSTDIETRIIVCFLFYTMAQMLKSAGAMRDNLISCVAKERISVKVREKLKVKQGQAFY
jgi:hypothetical protein